MYVDKYAKKKNSFAKHIKYSALMKSKFVKNF